MKILFEIEVLEKEVNKFPINYYSCRCVWLILASAIEVDVRFCESIPDSSEGWDVTGTRERKTCNSDDISVLFTGRTPFSVINSLSGMV